MESHEHHCHSKPIVHRNHKSYGCCGSGHESKLLENSKTRCQGRYTPGCVHAERRILDKQEEEEEIRSGETIENVPRYDKFALAKRLHAENLQHQPLPDRVDDRVFKDTRIASGYRALSAGYGAKSTDHALTRGDCFYGPVLGCRKPKTRMDLAICWETPIDPVYEPRRATHIDGTEGGSAPAIFALIEHTPVPKNRELLARVQEKCAVDGCGCADSKTRDRGCCCDCLCDGMKSVAVAEARGTKTPCRQHERARSNSVPPRITERKCAACKPADDTQEKEIRDPRLIRSAVGAALGLEKRSDDVRRNGLPPPKLTVPRPRTPFARRSFCIDTLAPPFSVVNGCRDADYPEHWRLMSVYQQSYRNPQKRRYQQF